MSMDLLRALLFVCFIKSDNFQLISAAVRFIPLLMLPSRGLDGLDFSLPVTESKCRHSP